MAHLTEEEVEMMYMQGNFWYDTIYGNSMFDYQAFAVAVQDAAERKTNEQG